MHHSNISSSYNAIAIKENFVCISPKTTELSPATFTDQGVLTKARQFNAEVRAIIDSVLGYTSALLADTPTTKPVTTDSPTTTVIPTPEPAILAQEPILAIELEAEQLATSRLVQEPEEPTQAIAQPTNAFTCVLGNSLKERFWDNDRYMLFIGDRVEAVEVLCRLHNPQFFIKPNGCSKDKVKLFAPRHLFHLLKGATNVNFTSLPLAA